MRSTYCIDFAMMAMNLKVVGFSTKRCTNAFILQTYRYIFAVTDALENQVSMVESAPL